MPSTHTLLLAADQFMAGAWELEPDEVAAATQRAATAKAEAEAHTDLRRRAERVKHATSPAGCWRTRTPPRGSAGSRPRRTSPSMASASPPATGSSETPWAESAGATGPTATIPT